jgi:uncharacterized protein (TIGR02246 family)
MFMLVWMASASFAQTKAEKEITAFLREEERIWNKGDLVGYVDLYMPDNTCRVIKKKGVVIGKEAILKDYQTYFTSKETMGQLTLEADAIEKITPTTYYVTGFFHLTYPDAEKIDGRYSTLMKKVKGKWYIYTDHSS